MRWWGSGARDVQSCDLYFPEPELGIFHSLITHKYLSKWGVSVSAFIGRAVIGCPSDRWWEDVRRTREMSTCSMYISALW